MTSRGHLALATGYLADGSRLDSFFCFVVLVVLVLVVLVVLVVLGVFKLLIGISLEYWSKMTYR